MSKTQNNAIYLRCVSNKSSQLTTDVREVKYLPLIQYSVTYLKYPITDKILFSFQNSLYLRMVGYGKE